MRMRLRLLFTISAAAGLAITQFAAASRQDDAVKGFQYNFGVVDEGAVVSHIFRIENTTSQPLRLSGYRVSCASCVSVAFDVSQVASGQITEVTTSLDTTGKGGIVRQWAAVMTDNPELPLVKMVLRGVVRCGWIDPKVVNLGMLRFDETIRKEFDVMAAGLPDLRIVETISSDPDVLEALIVDRRRRPTTETHVDQVASGVLTWTGSHTALEVGPVKKEVTIIVEDADKQRYRLPIEVHAYVAGSIQAVPTRIFFGQLRGSAIKERTVRARWRDEPFDLSRIELQTSHEYVRASLEVASDDTIIVRATLDAGLASETKLIQGEIRGLLGDRAVFAIPYSAYLAPSDKPSGSAGTSEGSPSQTTYRGGLPAVRAFVIAAAVGASTDNASNQDPHLLVPSSARISSEVVERLAYDLALRGGQVVWVEGAYDAYERRLAELRRQINERAQEKRSRLQRLIMPELDETYDLSAYSEEARKTIREQRAMLAQGVDPLVQNMEYVVSLNELFREISDEINQVESRALNELRTELSVMLTEEQSQRADRAWRRFQINLYDLDSRGSTIDAQFVEDPLWRIDTIGMLRDAAKSELVPLASAILAGELQSLPASLADITEAISLFENQYARLLYDYDRQYDAWADDYMHSFNSRNYDRARRLLRTHNNRRRRIFGLRSAFAEQIGALAAYHIGESARDQWMKRYRSTVCPSLYALDGVDRAMAWFESQVHIDEDQHAACDAFYGHYIVRRELLRTRAFQLEIDEVCSERIPLRSEPTSRVEAKLYEIHAARVKLSQQTLDLMRGLFAVDDIAALDEVIRRFHHETRRSNEVRP